MSKNIIGPHGIDITAPGGIRALMDFHRLTFGDAVMEEGAGAGAGGGNSDNGTGATGDQGHSGTGGLDDEQLGEGGKKALKAERDARSKAEKDLADAQTELQRLRDAGKSDGDKRQERFEQLEKSDREKDTTIATQQATILRYQIAAAKGLDLEAAERLRGNTKEEIEADADEFATKFGSKRVGEVPGAGHRGSDNANVAPGLSRLQQAYASTSK